MSTTGRDQNVRIDLIRISRSSSDVVDVAAIDARQETSIIKLISHARHTNDRQYCLVWQHWIGWFGERVIATSDNRPRRVSPCASPTPAGDICDTDQHTTNMLGGRLLEA